MSRYIQVTILDTGISHCALDIAGRVETGKMVLAEMFVKTPVHPQVELLLLPLLLLLLPQKADSAGIDWVFFADTLNFSFWTADTAPQYEVIYKGERYTGYLAFCAAINRALDSGVALTSPRFYSGVGEQELGELLKGEGGVAIPLLNERLACLKEVGDVLNEKWGGSFERVLEAAGNSAPKLLELVLENFPCFRDSGEFEGQRVSFHKRAQILVADLWCLFEGVGRGGLEHVDQLTMFADYRVPQSLQHYGVLVYSGELAEVLAREELMQPGCR